MVEAFRWPAPQLKEGISRTQEMRVGPQDIVTQNTLAGRQPGLCHWDSASPWGELTLSLQFPVHTAWRGHLSTQ